MFFGLVFEDEEDLRGFLGDSLQEETLEDLAKRVELKGATFTVDKEIRVGNIDSNIPMLKSVFF